MKERSSEWGTISVKRDPQCGGLQALKRKPRCWGYRPKTKTAVCGYRPKQRTSVWYINGSK